MGLRARRPEGAGAPAAAGAPGVRRERWRLRADVVPAPDGARAVPDLVERRFGEEIARVRASLDAWKVRVPQLRAGWPALAAFALTSVVLCTISMACLWFYRRVHGEFALVPDGDGYTVGTHRSITF